MSDPAEEFRKLAEAVGQMRQEVAIALDRAAPDYRRDLALLFTALKAIEQKPALSASVGALDAAARDGASNGAAEAINALRSVQRALEEAQRRQDQYVPWIERQSWYFWGGLWGVALALGLIGGTVLGVRTFPAFLIATEAGCDFVGGDYRPAKPSQQTAPVCAFWGKPLQ